jgi:predicted nucleotidyltransferase
MEPSFAKLLALLADDGVKFVVVGGVAVSLNGYLRLTEDVDILVEDSPANIGGLIASLSRFGEGLARELTPADFPDEEGAVRIIEESEDCMVDVFTRMRGLKFADIAADAATREINGRKVHYASKAGLIRLKSGSSRDKDALDVAALKRLQADPHAFD